MTKDKFYQKNDAQLFHCLKYNGWQKYDLIDDLKKKGHWEQSDVNLRFPQLVSKYSLVIKDMLWDALCMEGLESSETKKKDYRGLKLQYETNDL